MKIGRPKKYTDSVIEEIRLELDKYINETDIPIIVEFCYLNNIRRQRLYEFGDENELFSDTLKKCAYKKEANLEKLALFGKINPTMAIFSLKQHPFSWKDKADIDDTDLSEGLKDIVKAIRGS